MGSRSVAVCVVSDQPIVTAGIGTLLAGYSGSSRRYELVTDHRDAEVVIYDVFKLAITADRNRVGDLDQLLAAHPGRVLALSRLLQPGLTARALAAGAVAPVSIGANADELVGLVEAVAGDALDGNPELAAQNLDELTDRLRIDIGLTDRERSVLALIAAGYSNEQIAAELYLSINTIKTVIRSAYARIGTQTRAQAVAWAIEHGYASHRIHPEAAPHL